MATLTNAIKKVEKTTGQPIQRNDNNKYFVNYKGYQISFYQNGRDDAATCFYTLRNGQEDDSMTDYFAGTFWDNISQALNFVERQAAR